MNVKTNWSYPAVAVAICLFSGSVLAGGIGATGATLALQGDRHQEMPAAGDKDPKTPPDCKKYPRDPRCTKK